MKDPKQRKPMRHAEHLEGEQAQKTTSCSPAASMCFHKKAKDMSQRDWKYQRFADIRQTVLSGSMQKKTNMSIKKSLT